MNNITGLPMCKCNYFGCKGGLIGHLTFHAWLAKERYFKVIRTFIKRLNSLNYDKIDDIQIDGLDYGDYPDFCDAFISSATYKGRKMTEKELIRLNEDKDYLYESIITHIF